MRHKSLSLPLLGRRRPRSTIANLRLVAREGAAANPRRSLMPTGCVRHYGRSLCATSDKAEPEGTVQAVFVFHRHGDRTPGMSLVADEFGRDEALFWKTKIPPVRLQKFLGTKFPVVFGQRKDGNDRNSSSSSTISFREHQTASSSGKKNESYGFLTWKGLHQMYHNGRSMARRYNLSFGDCWDVQAVSTNYLRTVMSCQAFLDGLLTKNSHDEVQPLNYDFPTHYEKVALGDSTSNMTRKLNNNNDSNKETVQIVVRGAESETLNAFDTSRELMKKLVGDVVATNEFIANDVKANKLKAELTEYLPGLFNLAPYGEKVPSKAPSKRSKINWIHASDHFVCRSSHSVPVKDFCPHLSGAQEEEAERFERLKQATLSQLCTRFHFYYSNRALLGEMTGPALHEVVSEMKRVAQSASCEASTKTIETKKPFRIYSCHDVTILALLYALKGWCLELESPQLWPTYATCLTLELVQVEEGSSSRRPSFVVRAWLNEAPIPTFSPSPVAIRTASDTESALSIDLSKFEALVDGLNRARVSKSV